MAASHAIEAVYSGDTNFGGSTGSLTQTVSPATTSPTPPSAPPTGSVTFYDGAVTPADAIGTGTLDTNSNGVTTATFSTESLPAGAYALTAVYGGNINYPSSVSNVVSQTIIPAPLVITANNQSKIYGAALPTLTASYFELCQWLHCGQPDHRAHADHVRHRRQPCLGQPLFHHRQRCSRSQLHDQLCGRHADRHPGPADHHGQQSNEGLWRRPTRH